MQWSKLSEWLQLAAAIGVIVSLIFVGLEIQQSRQIAIADVFQQKSALAVQVQQGSYLKENFANAFYKMANGEELTQGEVSLLGFASNPWFQYWENVHFQYELGLLPESAWQASRRAIASRLRRPIYQEWWESERLYWGESFTREVDKILAEVRARRDH